MTTPDLNAPFPYFGGKRRIAHIVWEALGPVERYVEPFFGSGAVLLGRPAALMPAGCIEVANDVDGLLCNVWRAIQHAPDEVARYAGWPANENDLHARHAWLVGRREDITRQLEGDPEWYDAKAAGWWLWGAASWIGGGWCSGEGPWRVVDGQLLRVGGEGQGVQRRIIHLSNKGQGVQRAVKRQPASVQAWMRALSERLRRVSVASGDWRRVVTPVVLTGMKVRDEMVGVFLDPPYEHSEREANVYAMDANIALEVAEWARANGGAYRIVYAGYSGGGMESILGGWRSVRWKAMGGYGQRSNGRGRANAHRETLWISPACVDGAQGGKQLGFWGLDTSPAPL